mmetsp:Transcript_35933/g.86743  ORF Transcript_35933/g.86743 Transcript_35933/m.86743 type:complete len:258 (-) Transcript_35933:781-1554(-)
MMFHLQIDRSSRTDGAIPHRVPPPPPLHDPLDRLSSLLPPLSVLEALCLFSETPSVVGGIVAERAEAVGRVVHQLDLHVHARAEIGILDALERHGLQSAVAYPLEESVVGRELSSVPPGSLEEIFAPVFYVVIDVFWGVDNGGLRVQRERRCSKVCRRVVVERGKGWMQTNKRNVIATTCRIICLICYIFMSVLVRQSRPIGNVRRHLRNDRRCLVIIVRVKGDAHPVQQVAGGKYPFRNNAAVLRTLVILVVIVGK